MGIERDIDDAIDRAVREIMSVEPRPGLRGRVLTRIERGRAPAGWPRLAGALALAAAALVMLVWMRPAPVPTPQSQSASREPVTPVQPPVPPSAAQPPTRPATADRPATRPRAAALPDRPLFPARGVVAAATIADVVVDPADAAAPAPAIENPVAAPAIGVESIMIAPVNVERIVISAILPPR
jgi:hypothetical protein